EGEDEPALPLAGADGSAGGDGHEGHERRGGLAAVVAPEVPFPAHVDVAEALGVGDRRATLAFADVGTDDELEIMVGGDAELHVGLRHRPGLRLHAARAVPAPGPQAGLDLDAAGLDGVRALRGVGTV